MRQPTYPFADWQWRWLNSPGMPSFGEESLVRQAARAIALPFGVTGQGQVDGRSKLNVDRFAFLTEKRPWGNKGYYSCGDIAGGMLCFIGCRDEGIINRDDDDLDGVADWKPEAPTANEHDWWDVRGTRPWKTGWNITLLKQGSINAKCWERAVDGYLPQQGDIFMVGVGTMQEHVGIFVSDPEAQEDGVSWVYTTVEGGQVDASGQCAKVYTTTLHRSGGKVYTRRAGNGQPDKLVDGFINVAKVPLVAPALVPPDFTLGRPVSGLGHDV